MQKVLNKTTRFTGTALVAMAAAYAVAPVTASAKDPIPAQCQSIGDELTRLRCAKTYWQQKNQAAEARIATADREGQCLDMIMKDLESNGEKTAGLTEPPKRGEACQTARTLKLVAGI